MLKGTLKESWRKFDIKGFQEVSLLEWEGKLASILFVPGCNLRCPFCHAKDLVLKTDKMESISFERVVSYLDAKSGWIDGVAITGGEPTMCKWLFELIDEIKRLKLAVMIETNGTYPEKIKTLLDTERLNYIAMDIKTSFANSGKKYKEAAGGDVDIDNIKRSIDIIMSSDIDYEFRTTVVPGIIDTEDIIGIATTIEGAKRLCLQQFSPKDTLDPAYLKVKPYPREILEEMAEAARKFVKAVVIKNA